MPRGVSRAVYAGNGQAVEFPFFFKVWEEAQLSVLLTAPTGETAAATGWTAELEEDGGTVRYLHNGAPLPEGWKLVVMRDMPFTQEVDLVTGTRFDPEVIETALDMAAAERQQLRERLARAVVVAPTDEKSAEDLLGDIVASRNMAVNSATAAAASATAAAASAGAASGSAAAAAFSAGACAESAARAHAWAESETPPDPDDPESKSAKTWAAIAADVVPIATPEIAGKVRPQTGDADGLTLDADGRLKARAATLARAGIVRPDGATTTVNGDGLLSALGGNLLRNTGELITESGTWTAPVTGWYEIACVGGGGAGGRSGNYTNNFDQNSGGGGGGASSASRAYRYYAAGTEISVVIGAGGLAATTAASVFGGDGGETAFDGCVSAGGTGGGSGGLHGNPGGTGGKNGGGSGTTAGTDVGRAGSGGAGGFNGTGYGGGGGGGVSTMRNNTGTEYYTTPGAGGDNGAAGNAEVNGEHFGRGGNGGNGAVFLRYYDPAKAAGPAVVSAFALSRKAARAAQPAAVNLYDPETGQGSVWCEEDAPAKLAEGLITQEAWQELCAQQAAEAHAAWLADPDTGAERFRMLRSARDARLAVTDYLVAPDYPIDADALAEVKAYRQALRDLPARDGAPWDGGGELTPWPVPAQNTREAAATCA